MTPYTSQELAEHWEFKILRSSTGAFKDPSRLQSILDEEARAGWMLVEKFDNGRIRLKRPASARDMDQKLGVDAYRTQVGMSESKLAVVIIGATLGTMIIIMLIVMMLHEAAN